jgi:hypothetical protein
MIGLIVFNCSKVVAVDSVIQNPKGPFCSNKIPINDTYAFFTLMLEALSNTHCRNLQSYKDLLQTGSKVVTYSPPNKEQKCPGRGIFRFRKCKGVKRTLRTRGSEERCSLEVLACLTKRTE